MTPRAAQGPAAQGRAEPQSPAAPGSASGSGPGGVRALAARVRASKHLTGTLKRYWLTVLPHLTPTDRARLDAILRGETAPES